VGREDQPFRMRRASFAYHRNCPGEALPHLHSRGFGGGKRVGNATTCLAS
jgi:hypothetical protein